MLGFHEAMGFAIVSGWALLLLWGAVLFVTRRDAGRLYWGLLTVLQVVLAVQLVAGVVLLFAGGRRPLLHYLYGAVFPAIVLGVAHWLTRGLTKPPYHALFTIASFFIFGLTLRALQTGLGMP
ncbi:MAG TPA: hypothetical protein VKG45_07220 [Actinomycetes bacterium]|nr:hypothetical protein [Actinomycetes bacterium]